MKKTFQCDLLHRRRSLSRLTDDVTGIPNYLDPVRFHLCSYFVSWSWSERGLFIVFLRSRQIILLNHYLIANPQSKSLAKQAPDLKSVPYLVA